ncbi:hypothetical protein Csa_006281 [Cucumis sativus]|uniref:Uncharacterized protein n=1 Tax=Cucumis sativus TaxID=3659 RepID=A0A0A0LN60_CUCSA|nr:hypothetical protein Csa_006281 [Cucumis sativus]
MSSSVFDHLIPLFPLNELLHPYCLHHYSTSSSSSFYMHLLLHFILLTGYLTNGTKSQDRQVTVNRKL